MIRDDYEKKSIRDEYTKQSKKNKISVREAEAVRKMGARTYYSSRIPKLRDGLKVYVFSGVFVLIASLLLVFMVVSTALFNETELDVGFYIYAVLTGILLIYSLMCFFVFLPLTKKKIARYTKIIKEINEADAVKHNAVYDYILKNQNKNQGE